MKLVNHTSSAVTWISSGGVSDTGNLQPGQSAHLNAPRNVETRVEFFPSNTLGAFAEGEDIVTVGLTVTRGADDESGSLAAAADAAS
jgi:hypothetical protein